jgi:Uma2 family endonuclease
MYARHHLFTLAEYVRLEAETGVKHEFLGGQVWAMAGGSREHALFSSNVAALLANGLRGARCAVHSSDLRIGVKATGLRTYADVTVICGRVQLDPDDRSKQTVINPKIIVEVLSPSTEDYDRGEKLGHYKQIPSVEEVVLVAHDRREVEVVRRERDGSWSRRIARDGDVVRLSAVRSELPVAEIYRDPLARGVGRRGRTPKHAGRSTKSPK